MAQSDCTLRLRFLPLVLGGITCLLSSEKPARAAGCHIPDRPVLARTLSWERWLKNSAAFDRGNVRPAPPALAPLPCHGETPTTPGIGITIVAGEPAAITILFPPVAGERLAVDSGEASPERIAPRLERPPRRFCPFTSPAG